MPVISFSCPLPPIGLRRNSQTRNTNWRAALVREYQEQVWCAGRAGTCVTTAGGNTITATADLRFTQWPWQHARLELVWKHAGVSPDADNALASLKPLIDVLHTKSRRPLGLVVDDSPEHLIIERVVTEKVKRRVDECVEITLTEIA